MQCLDEIGDTPPEVIVDDPRIKLPEKEKVYTAIEELIE